MVVRHGYYALALQLQEAATSDLSNQDVCNRLRDCIADCYRGTGKWAYYVDHYGDAESGDVIFTCDGETMRASYEISGGDGAAKCVIDFENAKDVVPRTVYEEEQDDGDHYAAMESAKAYDTLPAYERYISKSERNAAERGSFAGKGKSFPILKPQDVSAAAHALGRAGSGNYDAGTIKKNIIRIAKSKGWTKYLPKAWRDGGDSTESAHVTPDLGTLALVESAATLETIVLREARADYPIKLIAPGKGSSAFYPAEVLKRDGPKVFSAGTHVYLNHPTPAEEAARPEGDVANLAGVLTTAAEYQENGSKGPGLYARMKVFADHAQTVEEKAPHVGMSIRASGVAESGKKQDGLPILKELTSAESVDVVTKAGAGGMILTEAARPQSNEESSMTEDEAKKLIEAAVSPFRERAMRSDARDEATSIMKSISLPEQAKARIVERAIATLPLKESGELNIEKLREQVVSEAKAEGEYLASITGSGRITGLGPSFAAVQDPVKLAEARKESEAEVASIREASKNVFTRLTGSAKAGEAAAAKGAAA